MVIAGRRQLGESKHGQQFVVRHRVLLLVGLFGRLVPLGTDDSRIGFDEMLDVGNRRLTGSNGLFIALFAVYDRRCWSGRGICREIGGDGLHEKHAARKKSVRTG